MGGDREMVMFSGLLSGILLFVAQTWFAVFLGLGLWCSSLWILRTMAKADPKMRDVYLRHRQYKEYYPARSTPFRINTPQQGRQYK